jgi:hypothetical protein
MAQAAIGRAGRKAGRPHLQLGHSLLLYTQHNRVGAPHPHRQRALAHCL